MQNQLILTWPALVRDFDEFPHVWTRVTGKSLWGRQKFTVALLLASLDHCLQQGILEKNRDREIVLKKLQKKFLYNNKIKFIRNVLALETLQCHKILIHRKFQQSRLERFPGLFSQIELLSLISIYCFMQKE